MDVRAWFEPLPPDATRTVVEQIQDAAWPSRRYFILVVLATVIASYGLVANSTATVIGAMIVAPLMGPILGLALGFARGDLKVFLSSLLAEALGVLTCVLTAMVVGFLVNPGHIDYQLAEIANRTHPTLYDMAIGLAAGVAAGYASVNPRVGNSIAGVAIAVALVPPLSVTGLSLAGTLAGRPLLTEAGSSFLLFFANLLTIEAAASCVFVISGIGHVHRLWQHTGLRRSLWLSLVLLGVTGAFLTYELERLLLDRRYQDQARQVVRTALDRIPGAAVQDVSATLDTAGLDVNVVAEAPEQIPVEVVSDLQRALTGTFKVPVYLRLGTVVATSLDADGHTVVQAPEVSPQQALLKSIGAALRTSLAGLPRADLVDYRILTSTATDLTLFATVRSAQVLDAPVVAALEHDVQRRLGPSPPALHLVVRSILSEDYTADGQVDMEATQAPTLAQRAQDLDRQVVIGVLRRLAGGVAGARLVTVDVQPPSAGLPLEVRATLASPRYVSSATVRSWQTELSRACQQPVHLTLDNSLGRTLDAGQPLTVPAWPARGR